MAFEQRHIQVHAVVYHTRHLPDTLGGTETLPQSWWVLKRGEALFNLDDYSRLAYQKMKIKLALLEAEKRIWKEG